MNAESRDIKKNIRPLRFGRVNSFCCCIFKTTSVGELMLEQLTRTEAAEPSRVEPLQDSLVKKRQRNDDLPSWLSSRLGASEELGREVEGKARKENSAFEPATSNYHFLHTPVVPSLCCCSPAPLLARQRLQPLRSSQPADTCFSLALCTSGITVINLNVWMCITFFCGCTVILNFF